jgi:hypothetical protein
MVQADDMSPDGQRYFRLLHSPAYQEVQVLLCFLLERILVP